MLSFIFISFIFRYLTILLGNKVPNRQFPTPGWPAEEWTLNDKVFDPPAQPWLQADYFGIDFATINKSTYYPELRAWRESQIIELDYNKVIVFVIPFFILFFIIYIIIDIPVHRKFRRTKPTSPAHPWLLGQFHQIFHRH
jgi:hypothetical protein